MATDKLITGACFHAACYINEATEGNVNALQAYIELKYLSDLVAKGLETIKEAAITEADRHPGKSFEAYGAKIEKRNGPSTYRFNHISLYNELKERVKYIEDIAKAGGGVDPTTGEVIEAATKTEGAATIAISHK